MGNQHSAPDKDKDKDKVRDQDKGKEQDTSRTTPRHERHRSRTIVATPLPPTETKVNAEQTPNNNIPADSKHVIESLSKVQLPGSSPGPVPPSSPVKERRASKAAPARDAVDVDEVKDLTLKNLPRPSEVEVRKGAEQTLSTPKFEAMRVPSHTSLVEEDELNEVNEGRVAQIIQIC